MTSLGEIPGVLPTFNRNVNNPPPSGQKNVSRLLLGEEKKMTALIVS
jgi:hypothetical protein